MSKPIPKSMKAVGIDRFGGPHVLHVASIPVPEFAENEILIRVCLAGVELVRRLGADQAVNGRSVGVAGAARNFAPDGLDAALAFANSENLSEVLKQVKKDGRTAYPNGLEPEPKGSSGIKVHAYDGVASPQAFERLNGLISRRPFLVAVSRTYRLEQAAQAHRDVLKHHLGKLGLRMSEEGNRRFNRV